MAEQFSIPTVGDLIAGKYRVDAELGRGAYGVVFRAEQEELGRDVAVKTLLPQAFLQQDIVQRFHREAQLISRLDHPNIIRLYDYGVDEGILYMAVEYVEGRTLMDVIENDAPLETTRVRELALQILDALEHAHGQGIVHRDLKPDNIVLLRTQTTEGAEYEVVKILDFGISKLIRGDGESSALKSLTQDGTVLGTPHYMSPENIVGDPIDHRADLYAFGVILYEMLAGVHPFDAPSASAVMVRHLRDDPPPAPESVAGTGLAVAIERALEKQPWDRIGSARELIELLETPAHQLPQSPRPASGRISQMGAKAEAVEIPNVDPEATLIDRPASHRRGALLLGGALLVVVALLTVLILVGQREDEGPDGIAEAGELPLPVVTEEALEPPVIFEPEVAEPSGVESESAADVGMRFFVEESDAGTAAVAKAPEALDDDERDPPAEPAAERPSSPRKRTPPPEPAVELVEVRFASIPTNASVRIDGFPAGSTPLKKSLPAGREVEVRFTHIGYKERTIMVTPDQPHATIEATLEKDHLRLID